MMGKTHIFIGTTSALLLTSPQDSKGLVTAVIGGALGGIICDVDTKSNKFNSDAYDSRVLALVICGCMTLTDFLIQGVFTKTILTQNLILTLIGLLSFFTLCIVGYNSKHRGFTHSFIGLALFTASIALFNHAIMLPFIIGFISHIVLDVFNKQPIKIIFPFGKGTCLKICYADKLANKIILIIGAVSTIGLISPN